MRHRVTSGPLLYAAIFLLAVIGQATGCSCNGSSQSGIEATILAPPDGASFESGRAIEFRGQASDSIGALSGDMLSWSSSLDGELGTGEILKRDDLVVGEHVITLTVSNETGASATDAISIEVVDQAENSPPVPTITSPEEGSEFDEGSEVILSGSAVDPEDGDLPGSALTWTSDLDGVLGNGEQLILTSLSLGVHLITLTALDSRGLAGRARVGIEIVQIGQNHAPRATILSPADGSAFTEGQQIELQGSATDDEDGPLGADALSWNSDIDGILGTGLQNNVTLSVGAHVITLTATDSGGKTGQDTISLSVNPTGNEPPQVVILEPEDEANFPQADEIDFGGTATDAEDGNMSGEAMVWTSDIDDQIGIGQQFARDDLSVGRHWIRLVATDSGSATGSDSIHLRITEQSENLPPVAEILEPPDGSSFERGEAVIFSGSGTDPEDGLLSGAALSWSSSLDGTFGNGTTVNISSLSEGVHTITLTVFDSQAAFDQDSISLEITPGQVENLPPTARLTGPSEAMARTKVTLDGSGSSDSDGSVVRYVFDFGDGSPVQDGSESTAEHVFEDEGPKTVILTVYDDDDAQGETTHDIEITPFVRNPVVVEDSRDWLGSRCALAFDANNRALIAYRNDTHPAVRLATRQEDGTFVIETVEGFGLDIGGDAGKNVTMALDAGGTLHMAYLLYDTAGDAWLRYARDNGSNWSLTTINQAGDEGHFNVSLEINPKSDKPEILFLSADHSSVMHTYCEGDCSLEASWTTSFVYTETRGWSDWSYAFPGGFAIEHDGTRHVAIDARFEDDSYDEYGELLYVVHSGASWDLSENVIELRQVYAEYDDDDTTRMVLDAAGQPLLLHPEGVYHRFAAGDWRLSRVESGTLAFFDIDYDSGSDTAYLLNRHGGEIEVIGENEQSYWLYRALGSQDQSWPDIRLDNNAEVRACFARDGNILLF